MNIKEQLRAIIMVIAAMLYCTRAAADSSGKCGDKLTWSYNSTNRVLTISGTGEMWDFYSALPQPWRNLNFVEVIIENGVTSIGDGAFSGRSGLTSISLPGSVTSIGESAFSGCRGLTSISLPGYRTSIGESAFSGCRGLTSISFPYLTSIGRFAFYGCSSLTSISIPSDVTSIGKDAFVGCGELSIIEVDKYNRTYDSRYNCNAIIHKATNTLVVGCKNTRIPYNVTSIGYNAFGGCSGLTSISLPSSVTIIGENAFSNCIGLVSIDISGAVTSIYDFAFYGCSSLTSVSIPSSVTSIGAHAFNGCSSLTSINIPSDVTYIGNCAFLKCSGLKSIKVLARTPPECEGDGVFDGVDKQKCELVVPRETVGLYKLRSPWKYFYNITAGIDAAKADRVNVAAVGGEIVVTGADGDVVVEVYGVNGMLVYRGKDKSVPVPSAGVYVVRVAGKTVKVIVN